MYTHEFETQNYWRLIILGQHYTAFKKPSVYKEDTRIVVLMCAYQTKWENWRVLQLRLSISEEMWRKLDENKRQ